MKKEHTFSEKFNLLKNTVVLATPLYFMVLAAAFIGGIVSIFGFTLALSNSLPLKASLIYLYLKSIFAWGDKIIYKNKEYLRESIQVKLAPYFNDNIPYFIAFFAIGFIIFGVITWILIKKASNKNAEKNLKDQHLRGSDMLTEKQLQADQKRRKISGDYITPRVFIDRKQDLKHLLVVGGVGSGKTVLISRLLESRIRNPLNKDAKFIINDLKPDWVEYFYNPETDYIFNYSDKRSIYFNIFSYFLNDEGEISEVDLVTLCALLIEEDPKDKMWTGLARDVMKAILIVCVVEETTTLSAIKNMLSWKASDLKKKFNEIEGTEKGIQALTGSDGTVGSVMVTLSSSTKFFEGISDTCHKGKDVFDLNMWLRKKGQSKIFMINDIKNKEFNAPKVSVFVDTLIKAIWALGEDRSVEKNRRIYFFLDELGAISKLNSLEAAITVGRSFGISVVIGIQDIAKFDKIYGEHDRKTIINSLSSKIILRLTDSDTAKYLSEIIGEKEYTETDSNATIGTQSSRDGIGFSTKTKTGQAVLASQIMDLKDHEFYFKQPEQTWTNIKGKFYPEIDIRKKIAEPFVECDGLRKKFGRKNAAQAESIYTFG